MHSERERKVMLRLTVLSKLQVIAQHLSVFGSYTIIDDFFCTLTRTLATQIRYTLFGYDNLNGVLRVIQVCYHRYDRRDCTVLRR